MGDVAGLQDLAVFLVSSSQQTRYHYGKIVQPSHSPRVWRAHCKSLFRRSRICELARVRLPHEPRRRGTPRPTSLSRSHVVCILTPHLIAAVDPIHLEVPPTARPLRRALHCVFKQTTDHVVTPRWSVDRVREQAAQVPVPDLQIRRALRADVSPRKLVR